MLVVYKRVGQTPLDVITQLKRKSDYKDMKMSYAGRLDPMAYGVMLILTGEETAWPQRFHGFEKEYKTQMLLGAESDSHDGLGLIKPGKRRVTEAMVEEAKKRLKKKQGKWNQAYPAYSGVKVEGKPLFAWARKGKLGDIKIPSKVVEVKELRVTGTKKMEREWILEKVTEKIDKVKGDFRQKEVLETWKAWAQGDTQVWILEFEIVTSAGLYIRSLCHEIGQSLGCGALALDIERVRVGDWRVKAGERLPVDGLKAV